MKVHLEDLQELSDAIMLTLREEKEALPSIGVVFLIRYLCVYTKAIKALEDREPLQ